MLKSVRSPGPRKKPKRQDDAEAEVLQKQACEGSRSTKKVYKGREKLESRLKIATTEQKANIHGSVLKI